MRGKWTPGPWDTVQNTVDITVHTGSRIIAGVRIGTGPRIGEQAANARLIAAAPDLYDALADLVARCDGDEGVRADGSNVDTCRAHAALAKARGAS